MKHLFSILTILFAVFAFLTSCGGSESNELCLINGSVTDKATNEAIEGVEVDLSPSTLEAQVTGSTGTYEFNDVPFGEYVLKVKKDGYVSQDIEIVVKSEKTIRRDVKLEKATALRIEDDFGNDISELDFGEKLADVSRLFNIHNVGSKSFEWEISFSADWIAYVSKERGELKAGDTQGIIVNIDRDLLESGKNETAIHITSDNGNKELKIRATNGTVLPTLNTLEATSVDTDSAVLNGEILTLGVPEYTERGFVYSTSSLPTIENTIEQLTAPLNDDAKYSAIATSLELGATYYVRAYAINAAGISYSTNVVSFKPHQLPPELKTEDPTNISISSGTATFNGTIEYEGDPAYTERGFVYGHAHNPTVEDDSKKEVTGNGEGAFSIKVTELEINTVYYIRAYAINEAGIGYGSEIMLDFDAVKPIVQTKEVTNVSIEDGTATFNGSIESVGDPAYIERGFVYGFAHNPTVEDDTKKVVSGIETGAFSVNVTELEMNKIYYIRAYAINSQNTAYGNEVMLDFNAVMPDVQTKAVTYISVSGGTATFNGTIVSVGDPAYTERGFVYGTVRNPTVEDDSKKVVLGNGEGDFSANVAELVMNKIYYIRAYAVNSQGIAYGNEIVLDFSAVMPVVGTSSVTAIKIAAGTATLNGTIVSVGDPAYTERGFVYGLTHNPTIHDTKKVVPGNGTGVFSANVTNLEMNKIYYVRAYATNVEGTVYGTEVTANFNAVMPVVSTSSATSINLTAGTATLNGKIDSIGDPAYTERGFVYAAIHNPTVEDDTKKVVSGTGTGAFSVNVSGLVLNTTYYIRAYAKSSQGISYGSEVSLNFKGTLPTVKTSGVSNISIGSKTATFNGSIENVGNPAYTERGFVYGLTHNPNIADATKKTASGSGTGSFYANVTNLDMNKTYYIRAYATNLQGTAYGNEVTLDFSQVFPVVTTNAVSNIDDTTATFNGTIEKVGDPAYTERGFIYGKMPVPVIDDTDAVKISVSGTGAGAYAHSVNNLETGTTYYVRAYAKVGTIFVYGKIINFVAKIPPYVTLATGLVVAREDAGLVNWSSAVGMCNNYTLAGFTDWRLPTINELMSIYNNRNSIGNFHSNNFNSDRYWSSTTSISSNYAYIVIFSDGSVSTEWKSDPCYVRCVR